MSSALASTAARGMLRAASVSAFVINALMWLCELYFERNTGGLLTAVITKRFGARRWSPCKATYKVDHRRATLRPRVRFPGTDQHQESAHVSS